MGILLFALFAKGEREVTARTSLLSRLRKRWMLANKKYNVKLNIWRRYNVARCSGNVQNWSPALAA
jgi:hypothetical protein